MPLLRIHAVEKDDHDGPYGTDGNGEALFVSFAKSWSFSLSSQPFRFGGWFSSDSIGQSNTMRVDEKGMTGIVSQIFPASDSAPAQLYFPWKTKSGRFWPDAATQDKFKPPYPSLQWNFSL